MRQITSDDELQRLREEGRGFIATDFLLVGAEEEERHVLHLASCSVLAVAILTDDTYFADDRLAAETWLGQERGNAWTYCSTCLP